MSLWTRLLRKFDAPCLTKSGAQQLRKGSFGGRAFGPWTLHTATQMVGNCATLNAKSVISGSFSSAAGKFSTLPSDSVFPLARPCEVVGNRFSLCPSYFNLQ